MITTIEIPLDIPDVIIERVEMNTQGDTIITVRSTLEGTTCRKCGRRITKGHGHEAACPEVRRQLAKGGRHL